MPLIILLHWDGLLERPGRGDKPLPSSVVRRLAADRGAALEDVAHVSVYRKQRRESDDAIANKDVGKWSRRWKRELRDLLPGTGSDVVLHAERRRENPHRWVCKGQEATIACEVLVRLAGAPEAEVLLVTDSAAFCSLETRLGDLGPATGRLTTLSWDSFAPPAR